MVHSSAPQIYILIKSLHGRFDSMKIIFRRGNKEENVVVLEFFLVTTILAGTLMRASA